MTGILLKVRLAVGLALATTGLAATMVGREPAVPQAQEIPLPEGPASETLREVCTFCHSLDRVVQKRWDREQWEEIIEAMLDEGADDLLEPAAIPPLLDYLATHFGPPEAAEPAP